MSKLASEYEVGAAVTHARTNKKGSVLANALRRGASFLAVEWDDGVVETVNAADLKDPLNEEFEALQKQVNEKLDAALKLVHEAHDLAAAKGHDLQDTGDSWNRLFHVSNIMEMVDIAGWSSSSMSC